VVLICVLHHIHIVSIHVIIVSLVSLISLFESLTALSFKLVPPHIYLAVVCLSWGIIASLQSLATSFTQLLLLRTVLGMAEAAFSGVPFYLSFFYRREELAFRTGIFIAAAPLATTFASSLAWLITWIAESGSFIAPWRLLFLVEGFPSVLVAWYCFKNVADDPDTAWFLTKKERRIAVARRKASVTPGEESIIDEVDGRRKAERKIRFSEVLQTLKDPKSYLTAVSS
jgi:MFS family permease